VDYRWHGLRLRSNIPFPELSTMDAAAAGHEVTFEVRQTLSPESAAADWELLLQEPECVGVPLTVRRSAAGTLLDFRGLARYFVSAAADHVICCPHPASGAELVRAQFLGAVSCFVLRHWRWVSLHASAVRIGDCAVAFVGPSRAGKSTLAAAFATQGYGTMADDLLPLRLDGDRIVAVAGPRTIRLWNDSMTALYGTTVTCPGGASPVRKRPVAAGDCTVSLPLGAVYVLDRRGDGVDIAGLSRCEALIALLRSGFDTNWVWPDWCREQFAVLSCVAQRVSIRRLRFANDLRALPVARSAIAADVANLLPQADDPALAAAAPTTAIARAGTRQR
jgi:hypothetical protein